MITAKTATSTIIGENHHFPTRISKKRRRKWIRKVTRYKESKMEQRTVSGGKDASLLCGWGFKIRILTNSTKTRRRERERDILSCVLHLALKFYCSVRVCQVRLLKKKTKKQLPEPVAARRFVRLRVLGVLHWCVRLYLGVQRRCA